MDWSQVLQLLRIMVNNRKFFVMHTLGNEKCELWIWSPKTLTLVKKMFTQNFEVKRPTLVGLQNPDKGKFDPQGKKTHWFLP